MKHKWKHTRETQKLTDQKNKDLPTNPSAERETVENGNCEEERESRERRKGEAYMENVQ